MPAGRLYLDRGSEVLHILDITIAPAKRNAGIGSYVLEVILREARQSNKRVTIHVESFNPSLRLFERLGFRKAEETGFHFLMEWKSSPGTA
jgi:ribosomal protein S18 acetylase RimI-like enzyme